MRPVQTSGLGPVLAFGGIVGLITLKAPLVGLSFFLIYALMVWIDYRLEVLRARR